MARRAFIAGNWKMNSTAEEGVTLTNELLSLIEDVADVDVVLAPPFTSLDRIGNIIKDNPVRLSAQNFFMEPEGAYTGEISAAMLLGVGCVHVIIGHSERRQLFGETDETINKKTAVALNTGLKPIVCVGEVLEEREAGKALEIVTGQVRKALLDINSEDMGKVVVAYEPVWAIGTGKTATPDDAQEVHRAIRDLLVELYNRKIADSVRIIYGGSVKPDNVDSLMAMADIDGALVGGASLKAESFARLVNFQPLD